MSKNVTLAVRLNGTNYPLWSRLMKIAIGTRKGYRHITGQPPPPLPKTPEYPEWEDLIVFSWIIDNIETDIVMDFAHHQTAQALWESLTVTYESVSDPYLIYDLDEKVGKIVQGEQGLETYWRQLHGAWTEIDRSQAKPITCCDKGVGQHRKDEGARRLFKFLRGLNPKYESVWREILREDPWPSAEAAYGWVKKEALRLKIMQPETPDHSVATNGELTSSGGVGYGFGARGQRPQSQQQTGPPNGQRPQSQQQTGPPNRPVASNR